MRQSFILILDARGSEENVVDVASFLSHLLRAPVVQWQTIEHTVAVGAHKGYPISPLKSLLVVSSFFLCISIDVIRWWHSERRTSYTTR